MRRMESVVESTPPNGDSRHVLLTTVDLAQHVSGIEKRLEELKGRFEAHAEQEEDRSRKTSERLEALTAQLHKLGALPAFALPNLLAQSGEGEGPTGTNALVVSALSGLFWMVLPKVQEWLRSRSKP